VVFNLGLPRFEIPHPTNPSPTLHCKPSLLVQPPSESLTSLLSEKLFSPVKPLISFFHTFFLLREEWFSVAEFNCVSPLGLVGRSAFPRRSDVFLGGGPSHPPAFLSYRVSFPPLTLTREEFFVVFPDRFRTSQRMCFTISLIFWECYPRQLPCPNARSWTTHRFYFILRGLFPHSSEAAPSARLTDGYRRDSFHRSLIGISSGEFPDPAPCYSPSEMTSGLLGIPYLTFTCRPLRPPPLLTWNRPDVFRHLAPPQGPCRKRSQHTAS